MTAHSAQTNQPAAAAHPPMGGDAEAKKKRNLMTEILDIAISNARCQSHMKAALIPAEIENILTEKRAALRAAKEAAQAAGRSDDGDAAVAAIKEEIDGISEKVVRIGGDAPIAMASLCDYTVKSAVRHAMQSAHEAKSRMVEISALLSSGDPTALDFWPLICDLPSIASYSPENEAALKAQRAVENREVKEARRAARESKAAAGGLASEEEQQPPASKKKEQKTQMGGKKPPTLGGALAAEKSDEEAEEDEEVDAGPAGSDAEEGEEDEHGPTTTFHTYVDAATKAVKKEEKAFASMRVSNRLREFISQMVAELVARYSLVAKVLVMELLGVRTLNASHLLALVKTAYVSKLGVEEAPRMLAILTYITGKVERYHAHLEAEKSRKWEEMDPAKQSELAAKQALAAEGKKRREAAKAKAKALELAKKAQTLLADGAARTKASG